LTREPRTIREKNTGKKGGEYTEKTGHIGVSLDGRRRWKHRTFAEYFIPNLKDYEQVDRGFIAILLAMPHGVPGFNVVTSR
jgi:hypothetical protein